MTLTIHDPAGTRRAPIEPGQTVYDVLMANGRAFEAPCGGKALCGKCRMKIIGAQPPGERERAMLADGDMDAGIRLACLAVPAGDAEVFLPDGASGAVILTGAAETAHGGEPLFSMRPVSLPQPGIHDQRDDLSRLAAECGFADAPVGIIRSLPYALRKSGFQPFVSWIGERAARVSDQNRPAVGIAVDVGTTTVAAYLMDLATGRQLAVSAQLNAQRAQGADVLSRCGAAETADGLASLATAITGQIGCMAADMCAQAGISTDDALYVTIAGNTVMMHLFAGVSPAAISAAPFTPAFTQSVLAPAPGFGIPLPNALVRLLPSVAGYVGADTVAAALACGMDISDDIALLIDIGTNGEIALGNKDGLLCCSAAAGPAFEGAHISCGMGAVNGAINGVRIDGGKAACTVIGGGDPSGLCGSGLVDVIAGLKAAGIMDDTGLLDADSPHVVQQDGKNAFHLAPGVSVTQADIRQVQLAKSAIASGIDILLKESGLGLESINRVYLAGGFGNYIRVESACDIGLIPKALKDSIRPVGNAAGSGAQAALLWRDCHERVLRIPSLMRYIELSARPDFQDLFVDNMFF